MWDPDTRWIENESGFAGSPNFNRVNVEGAQRILPGECDCMMRREKWFYSDTDEDTVKSLEELMGIYYYSVGRGANLLINIGPDRRGLLPEKDSARLLEFGAEIRRRFSNPLPSSFKYENGVWVCSLTGRFLADHLIIKESCDFDDEIEHFTVNAYPSTGGKPIKVYEGGTIGHKAICRFPHFFTGKLELVVDKQDEGRIVSMEVFNGAFN
jgi:alpha-L-fucosidase